MKKILSLDIGDQWVGVAISDKLGLLAKPYDTIILSELENFLKKIIEKEKINIIVIGYPKTMKGTKSEQTKKIIKEKEKLEKIFNQVTFILWDERLSSKRAQQLKQAKTKEEKLKSHSIAAAFILDSYLTYIT
jgi:putative Holliday junction resolvase